MTPSPKSRPLTDAEWLKLRRGKPSAKRVDRVMRSKHEIATHYMPTIGGMPVRSKSGLFFKSRDRAVAAAVRSRAPIAAKGETQ